MPQNISLQPYKLTQKLDLYFSSPSRKAIVSPGEQIIRDKAETNALDDYHNTVGRLGKPESIGFYIVRLLTDPNPKVRATTAYFLGELKDADSLPFLVKSMASAENDIQLMQRIEEAIKKISGKETVDVLHSYLDNPTTPPEIKIYAIIALSFKGEIPKDEVPVLAQNLLRKIPTPTDSQ